MPTGIKLTKEKKDEVVKIYQNQSITISKLAKLVELSNPTVIKILDEYKITRHKKARILSPDMDEHYFDVIDKEEKAYFLGFIITDGNVFCPKNGNRQKSISITQYSNDEYILRKFKDEIKVNTSIAHDGRGCSQISIRSNIMSASLSKYGIVENKTLVSYLPIVSDEYMPHLIRGILDGDGHIKAIQTNNRNRFLHSISFSGTHQLMEDISNYLSTNLGVLHSKVYDYTNRHLSEVKWQSKDDMKKIGDWIYRDATVYLIRKYKRYKYFHDHYFS